MKKQVFRSIFVFAIIAALVFGLNVSAYADPIESEQSISTAQPAQTTTIEITKHPTSESYIAEGSSAIFISRAKGYTSFHWEVLTSDGIYNLSEISDSYPYLDIEGADTGRIKIKHLSFEQYGWQFRCVYANTNGECASDWAELLIVNTATTTCPRHHCLTVYPDPYGGTPIK